MSFEVYIKDVSSNTYYSINPENQDALNQELSSFKRTIDQIITPDSDPDSRIYNFDTTQSLSITAPSVFAVGACITALVTQSSLACCFCFGGTALAIKTFDNAFQYWTNMENEAKNKVIKLIEADALKNLTRRDSPPNLTNRVYIIDYNPNSSSNDKV